MRELVFDVMVGEWYACTLTYLFNPKKTSDLRAFVIAHRPTLRNVDFVCIPL